MKDLGFAIDDLYASGWWPTRSDRCLRHEDARWYPDESLILERFAGARITPVIHESDHSSSVEIVWRSEGQGRQSVRGRSRHEALILAFTSLYRQGCARAMRV